jgi:hypothetical protein
MLPPKYNPVLHVGALLLPVVAVLTLLSGLLFPPLARGESYQIGTDPNIQTRVDQFVPNPFHEPVRPPRQYPAKSKQRKKAKRDDGRQR